MTVSRASTEAKPGPDQALLDLANRCVQCGLCLPHCPTYRHARTEAESPRGRIALAKALIDKPETFDARAAMHWDNCLSCGACQSVCPSNVDFHAIATESRHLIRTLQPEPAHRRWLRGLRHRPHMQRWLATLARGPLGQIAATFGPSWLGRMRTLAILAPRAPEPLRGPSPQRSRGAITLFAGCLGHLIDTDTLHAAHRLLHRLGYEVTSAPPELCCGTWPHHAGDLEAAKADALRCRTALMASSPGAVVHLASGCDAGLRTALAETHPVWEICTFLAEHAPLESLSLSVPAERHIALMVPCSQSSAAPILSLLGKVPRLKVSVLPQQPRCCGAAGMQFIDHAALSDSLRDEKLAQIVALQADLVLSNNHACRMHLRAGLHAQGRTIPVMHPAAFLETLCT